ncbi:hypothetical protein METUNv1_03192 [Methyloversatilis universalis FAM5]|uniref:Uncharacterized protein n=1 Tax=Methyloversatilis universalis (strain ATCC BAA-1314 / DSM 25237 / JCM 13912 / CCUG 52030 / FAM5) TaxID=1000565 RepID=F5RG96_METUF|nr:hypothetical protein METUNv1_03192 [Methyloversatilis universalis FAM5]
MHRKPASVHPARRPEHGLLVSVPAGDAGVLAHRLGGLAHAPRPLTPGPAGCRFPAGAFVDPMSPASVRPLQ